MIDFICMLSVIGFFGLSLWMVWGLERLNRGGGS
jgi:hypothetical protein